eukprot:3084929-Alexandrium_andersonii.AAC.1
MPLRWIRPACAAGKGGGRAGHPPEGPARLQLTGQAWRRPFSRRTLKRAFCRRGPACRRPFGR